MSQPCVSGEERGDGSRAKGRGCGVGVGALGVRVWRGGLGHSQGPTPRAEGQRALQAAVFSACSGRSCPAATRSCRPAPRHSPKWSRPVPPRRVQRSLYPNVDFYSGIVLRALGIPVEM